MTTTAWAHLPNAEQIDRVLAHVKIHPERWNAVGGVIRDAAWNAAWGAAWGAVRDAAWNAAWNAAWGAAWGAVRGAVRDAVWGAAWNAAWNAAWGAILALIAYDDCAHYLNLTPGAVRVAASAGVPAAILLLPAVIAMEKTT